MINLLIFLLGIAVGSFLNVLIDRIPQGQSFLKGRSHCDFCKKTLAWYDLIPILSFILLQGKCRYCHKSLSFQYPLIELATGVIFLAAYQFFSGICLLIVGGYFLILSGLLVLFMMDLKYGILADEIVFPLILISVIILIYQYMIIFFMPIIIGQRVFTAILTSTFFLSLAIITKGKGMGGGDVKLAFVMGLILGFPNIIIALYMSFLSGGVVASILLILKKKHFGQTIPFGPFLALSTILTIFFGDQIWLWYSQKFLGW